MKYSLIALLMSISTILSAQNNAIEKYFSTYEDHEDFTSVYISEYMFSLFANVEVEDKEDEEILKVLSGLKKLQVLTTEKDGMKYFEQAIKKIDTKDYELLMKVREESSKVQFYIKKQGETIRELFLVVGNDSDFILLSIEGDIKLSQISNLAKYIDVEGLEHLEGIEGKEGESQ